MRIGGEAAHVDADLGDDDPRAQSLDTGTELICSAATQKGAISASTCRSIAAMAASRASICQRCSRSRIDFQPAISPLHWSHGARFEFSRQRSGPADQSAAAAPTDPEQKQLGKLNHARNSRMMPFTPSLLWHETVRGELVVRRE